MEPLFFVKVQRALELIGRSEPRRLARISEDIDTIAGLRGGNSFYLDRLRLIALSWNAVLPARAADVALTIIHEATHARFHSVGIGYPEPLRGRIEARCVKEEAAFAMRLPDGEVLAQKALAKLEKPWWTPDELHRLEVRRARAHLMPEWFIRFMDWRHRRRRGRARREES